MSRFTSQFVAESRNDDSPRSAYQPPTPPANTGRFPPSNEEIIERLRRLEESLAEVTHRIASIADVSPAPQPVKEYLTTQEFADAVGKAVYTCRAWARNARINCERAKSFRGPYAEFRIHVSEVDRYRREGLLPLRKCFARRDEP